MSPTQLHQVFHVDDVNQVPNYELIKLTHLSTVQHVRKKRSIDTAVNSLSSFSGSNNKIVSNHHVKKDLSKIPYSEKSNSIFGADKKSSQKLNKKKNKFTDPLIISTINNESNKEISEKIVKIEDHENIKVIENPQKDQQNEVSDLNLSNIKEHIVSFDAFGTKHNLTLRPTEGLFRDGPQSLKMWHAHPDPNATDGINYEEIRQVRNTFILYCISHDL